MSNLKLIYDVEKRCMLPETAPRVCGPTNFMSWNRAAELLEAHEMMSDDEVLTHIEVMESGLNLVFGRKK